MNLDTARSIRLEGSNVTVLNRQLGQLSVSGHDNAVNLTDVDRVDIQGNKNLVLARAVKQVRFSGNDNTVNPSSNPLRDDRGSGSGSGSGNKVM
ncbi:secreted protein [Xanthomonas citri pv. mangiferaeindicae LMG 941]|nr:secreted protein [Xanthomonas citri pv. mangiferaeindicae LMG 941]